MWSNIWCTKSSSRGMIETSLKESLEVCQGVFGAQCWSVSNQHKLSLRNLIWVRLCYSSELSFFASILGKCPICEFVFCMECKRTSHGNLACGDNTKLKIDQEEKHSDEDREKISKDFEMFEMIIKRQEMKSSCT